MSSSATVAERFSPLQQARLTESIPLPKVLRGKDHKIVEGAVIPPPEPAFTDSIRALFPNTFGKPSLSVQQGSGVVASSESSHPPLRVGIVLSGGQAPGGHNVIAGVLDALKSLNPSSTLIGFKDGPKGLLIDSWLEVTEEFIANYRNMGGFDSCFSGRDKIESNEDLARCVETLQRHKLDGLIIAGGDDSNTNQAVIAEYVERLAREQEAKDPTVKAYRCRCVGCPKTIDGDLVFPSVGLDTSFGFDTACRVYSEQVGALAIDSLSSNKYQSWVRVMGRAASNIALEVALQTHPNICLIGEEIAALHKDLSAIVEDIVDLIVQRAERGIHHSVIIVPEGLIEFVPSIGALLRELNDLLAAGNAADPAAIADILTPQNSALFRYLPANIQRQLLADRDSHGNVQVSLISTEELLSDLVSHELDRLKKTGHYKGTYQAQTFFCGYEGRSGLPSRFDACYCYAMGYNAAVLIDAGANAVMSVVSNLDRPVEDWTCGAVPLTAMMTIERRKGKDKPVIKKWLVDLQGAPFKKFVEQRQLWGPVDSYRNPGPLQFYSQKGKSKSRTAEAAGNAAADNKKTDVGPLTFTLALMLEQKEKAKTGGLHISAGGAAAAGGAGAAGGGGDLAGYKALLEGILETGLESVSAKDLKRLTLFRAAHAIKDSDHFQVLHDKFGITKQAWREQLARLHIAAGAASPALAT